MLFFGCICWVKKFIWFYEFFSHTFANTYFWFVKDQFGLILGVYKGVLLTCGNCMKSPKNIIFNPPKVEVMKNFISVI